MFGFANNQFKNAALLAGCVLVQMPCWVYAQEGRNGSIEQPSELDRWDRSLLGVQFAASKVTGVYSGFKIDRVVLQVKPISLQRNDILLQIGALRFDVGSSSDLKKLLNQTKPNQELPAEVLRGGRLLSISVPTHRPELVDADAIAEIVQANQVVRAHLAKLHRLNELDSMAQRMADAVEQSSSPRLAQEAINDILDQLDISHTAYVPREAYQQLQGRKANDLGLVLRLMKVDQQMGYFVVDIKPGSPASNSPIRLGDAIDQVNQVPIEQSRRLILAGEEQRYGLFALQADSDDETLTISHQHSKDTPFAQTSLTPAKSQSLQTTTQLSARVIESEGRSVGYLRFWNLMSEEVVQAFAQKLQSEFGNCEALILDLRGRGGTVEAVVAIEKIVHQLDLPMVVIVDELTRSAKEILACRLKPLDNVHVLGENTAGAVTAASFSRLPSGNYLMHPQASSEHLKSFTYGQVLEGQGVQAEEVVPFFEPYCNGKDELLLAAIRSCFDKAVQ